MPQTRSSQSNVAARRGGTVASGGRGGGRGTAVGGPGGGGGSAAPPPILSGRGRRNLNPFAAIAMFIRDVRSELRKVAWPSNRETVNLTMVVLALSVAVGLFLGGTDFLFQELFRKLIELTSGGSA